MVNLPSIPHHFLYSSIGKYPVSRNVCILAYFHIKIGIQMYDLDLFLQDYICRNPLEIEHSLLHATIESVKFHKTLTTKIYC